MIWALIVLAALPLAMGAMMIFFLRSGRLQRLQQQNRDGQARAGDGSGLEVAAAAGWSVAPTDSFAGGGDFGGGGADGGWDADAGGDSGGGSDGGDGGGGGGGGD